MRVTETTSYNLSLSLAELDSLILAGYCKEKEEYEMFAVRRNTANPGSILTWDEIMNLLHELDTVTTK